MKKKKKWKTQKKIIKTKKAITIVVLMSKVSHREVLEGVKLTAENEILFYLLRIKEK